LSQEFHMKRLLAFMSMLVLLTGCRTATLANWNSRIGSYTYDLALVDLGVPERSVKLKDGSLVADWVTRRSTPGTVGIAQTGNGTTPPFWYNPVPNTILPTPAHYLRLTFDSDQKLAAWEKFER
jgi:hypothetical protein